MSTRREFLRRAGATVTPSTAALALAGAAAATHMDYPSHISIDYPQSWLEQYRPQLHIAPEDKEKLLGFYGFRVRSPEYPTDVAVFWASYTHQDSWLFPQTAHPSDHEPVQVEVDSETGEVQRVRASIYHWIKGEATPGAVPMDGSHPRLAVVTPWHQYRAARPSESTELLPVEDLTAVYPEWLDDGMAKDLTPGASTQPWIMRTRGDFWRADVAGVSFNAAYVSALKRAKIGEVGSLTA